MGGGAAGPGPTGGDETRREKTSFQSALPLPSVDTSAGPWVSALRRPFSRDAMRPDSLGSVAIAGHRPGGGFYKLHTEEVDKMAGSVHSGRGCKDRGRGRG